MSGVHRKRYRPVEIEALLLEMFFEVIKTSLINRTHIFFHLDGEDIADRIKFILTGNRPPYAGVHSQVLEFKPQSAQRFSAPLQIVFYGVF